ncbi:type II toxin-antitoxin system RelE/ParE family toxin [Ottowia pentelensis]|uniref:Type II toxin-antitoxin system RelE/ParE family toxin n=1 Tax=Ottowia pentelensis TaxID=511108 RepID=A0ABV6PQI9_9BURK|nr:type II toxin-antitoxin system RelE/ParE family toxin [Pseudomonadota bacterium]MBS0414121.1 type II toxin-antitoxin system RelE/ParE family toxin [Pseudomonadota bacterium]HMN56639.1 type II toxin-antitoxin system RelE/ParE family toxin [Ottowia sp.]
MFTVVETEHFTQWINGLRDLPTRIRLLRRLGKAARGQLGDVKPVGQGVWEMREFFGPGWRMYYVRQGGTLIVMLGGGDKASQQADIRHAHSMAQELSNEQDQDPPV